MSAAIRKSAAAKGKSQSGPQTVNKRYEELNHFVQIAVYLSNHKLLPYSLQTELMNMMVRNLHMIIIFISDLSTISNQFAVSNRKTPSIRSPPFLMAITCSSGSLRSRVLMRLYAFSISRELYGATQAFH